MTRREHLFLIATSLTMAAAAISFVVHPPEIGTMPPPADARVLAQRIARHPADWEAASALAEVSLDTQNPQRVALWRAAYQQATMLAPERTDPGNSFARAAFFHWAELSPQDQRAALAAFAPLLRRPGTFARMARPLFELTGDLSILRSSHPPTEDAIRSLMALALPNGLFADYRQLRTDLARQVLADFSERRNAATPEDLIAQFPRPPFHADAEPLIEALLQTLHSRPLFENPGNPVTVEGIIDYALRHDLQPLDGLEFVARSPGAASPETRLKLARKLNLTAVAQQLEIAFQDPRRVRPQESEWQGGCGTDVCNRVWRNITAAHGIALTISTGETDNVPAYVEIYVDDALRAEGETGPKREFVAAAGSNGTHRIEVVLANPTTRNGGRRRVHIDSITTL
jgi:hypothetical protein